MPRRSLIPRLCALLTLLALSACSADPQVPPAPAQAPAGEPAAAAPAWPTAETAEAAPNPLARLLPTLVRDGAAMELLAVGLRPEERMVAARLRGPDGRVLNAEPAEIRQGHRYAGGAAGPRIGLSGGSNSGVGVTFSLDLFGDRTPPPVPSEGTRAWVEIPLPTGSDPAAWRAEALIEDSFGERYVLAAG